jgi:hypothetical protein
MTTFNCNKISFPFGYKHSAIRGAFAFWQFPKFFVSVHLDTQIGRWIQRILKLQLIAEMSLTVVFNDREMQVYSCGIAGVA